MCISWFSLLNQIHQEYVSIGKTIFVAGISKKTDNSSIDDIVTNKQIPYLKDGIAQGDYVNNVWDNWEANDRDVYVIDKDMNWTKINLNGLSEDEAEQSIKDLVDEMLN